MKSIKNEVSILNNRIKQLRNELGLSGEKFGEQIGLKRNSLSQIETGKNNPSEQTILSICREFGVNEQWLRYGEGEMFPEKTEAEELASLVPKIIKSDNPFVIKTLTEMCKLSPESWDEIEKMIKKIAKED